MDAPSDWTNQEFEAVREVARRHSYERYVSALLAPKAVREDLIALAAFAGEIERVALVVSDTNLGEIRLNWWLEALAPGVDGALTGNPVADAFFKIVAKHDLPLSVIRSIVDTRAQELYAEPFGSEAEWVGFLRDTDGQLFKLAGHICGASGEPEPVSRFGAAYGAARQIARVPQLAMHGRWGLWTSAGDAVDATGLNEVEGRARANRVRDKAVGTAGLLLAEARANGRALSRQGRHAILPAALVEPYLGVLQKAGDWLQTPSDLLPLTRVWRLWRARYGGPI